MPPDVVALFTDQGFLSQIASCLDDKELTKDAIDTLEYIEEPTLAVLESEEQTTTVLRAIAGVKKEIERREMKYPNSSWSSAYKTM